MLTSERNNLENLVIEPGADRLGISRALGYDFVARILKQYAPTVKRLSWDAGIHFGDDADADRDESQEPIPKLPQLQGLTLTQIKLRSISDVASLVLPGPTCKLSHLGLYMPNELTGQYLASRGTIPSLLRFVWKSHETVLPISFLQANSQIEVLSLSDFILRDSGEEIPRLLSRQFHNLRSLELKYDEPSSSNSEGTPSSSSYTYPALSDEALQALSKLTSLEKLHLQLGQSYGWKRTWVPDHSALRRCVKQLPRLRVLALSRDTYDPEHTGNQWSIEHYYDRIWVPKPLDETERRLVDSMMDVESDSEREHGGEEARISDVFEMMHRRRMRLEGNKYVKLRHDGGPSLEFIYFGQVPMKVKRGRYGWRANAATERRDELYSYLRRTFQQEEDLFDYD